MHRTLTDIFPSRKARILWEFVLFLASYKRVDRYPRYPSVPVRHEMMKTQVPKVNKQNGMKGWGEGGKNERRVGKIISWVAYGDQPGDGYLLVVICVCF